MKIGAIVQARTGSRRLPGKVLRDVAGKPLLQYVLERLERCAFLDTTVVATSVHESDAPIASFCRARGVPCCRGPLLNVAARFKEVLDVYEFDGFVRVNADSPLLDQHLIERGIRIFLKGRAEVVTNVLPRTFPHGQSVEVVDRRAFLRAYELMRDAGDFEHVTPILYERPGDFKISSFRSRNDYSEVRLSVDTEDDLRLCGAILARMKRPHWEYRLQDILRIYRRVLAQGRAEEP